MSSTFTLHAAPGAGFEQPFEMLLACHERVERMLDLLERLARHLNAQGCDANARQAACDVMRYFDLAGPAHHEDEERHVFPLLRACGDVRLSLLAERLLNDHQVMTRQWQALRADLQEVAAGRWSSAVGQECGVRWAAYAALYRAHIVAEEAQAYPAAQPRLDLPDQAAMGREMAQRRGAR